MSATPLPWSLAWREDGELAAQDRFDLLQCLIQTETLEVQTALITAVEQLASTEISVLTSHSVTGLYA